VAEFVRDHPREILFASAREIADRASTSDATVIRAAKALGFSGLPELKRAVAAAVAAETRPSAFLREHLVSLRSQAISPPEEVFEEGRELIAEMRRSTSPAEFTNVAKLMAGAREIWAFGVGPSGLAAEYLALKLQRRGLATHAVRSTGWMLADDLLRLSRGDVVVLFAPGRLFREFEVICDRADEVGAHVILVTDTLGPVLGPRADHVLACPLSPTGGVGEVLCQIATVDAITLCISALEEGMAVAASETLTQLRGALARRTGTGEPEELADLPRAEADSGGPAAQVPAAPPAQ
jgi:DNA-binding MurR/RpiR family transcriptional regulator